MSARAGGRPVGTDARTTSRIISCGAEISCAASGPGVAGCRRYYRQMHVEPYAVAVPEAVLEDLRERIRRTRWPDPAPGEPWSQGTDLDYLSGLLAYWADGFDWRAQERQLNRYAPFSSRPPRTGVDRVFVARLWHQLMQGLGYQRYGAYGGDFGAGIATQMALTQPDRMIGIHLSTPEIWPYLIHAGLLRQPLARHTDRTRRCRTRTNRHGDLRQRVHPEGQPPRSWYERLYQIQRWTVFPRGGHFAAIEEPDLLADDLADFFTNLQ